MLLEIHKIVEKTNEEKNQYEGQIVSKILINLDNVSYIEIETKKPDVSKINFINGRLLTTKGNLIEAINKRLEEDNDELKRIGEQD